MQSVSQSHARSHIDASFTPLTFISNLNFCFCFYYTVFIGKIILLGDWYLQRGGTNTKQKHRAAVKQVIWKAKKTRNNEEAQQHISITTLPFNQNNNKLYKDVNNNNQGK